MKKICFCWLPALLWAAVIFVLSAVPSSDIPALSVWQEAGLHALEYLIFALLASRAWRVSWPAQSVYRRVFLIFTFALIYAIIDELHQAFVPGRDTSLKDIGYDALGIAVASILYP